MIDHQARRRIEEIHEAYRTSEGQEEHADEQFMVAHGHPCARTYLVFRKFFDSLTYASDSSARFFSFVQPTDQVQYRKPRLMVARVPDLLPEVEDEGYLCGPGRLHYLKACAAARWPACLSPALHSGGFEVTSQNRALVDALRPVSDDIAPLGHGIYWVGVIDPDIVRFNAARHIIQQYHRGYILPRRRHPPAAVPRQRPTARPDTQECWAQVQSYDAWI